MWCTAYSFYLVHSHLESPVMYGVYIKPYCKLLSPLHYSLSVSPCFCSSCAEWKHTCALYTAWRLSPYKATRPITAQCLLSKRYIRHQQISGIIQGIFFRFSNSYSMADYLSVEGAVELASAAGYGVFLILGTWLQPAVTSITALRPSQIKGNTCSSCFMAHPLPTLLFILLFYFY